MYISILMLNTVAWMVSLLKPLVFLEAGIDRNGFHDDFHLHSGPKSCSQLNSTLIADPYWAVVVFLSLPSPHYWSVSPSPASGGGAVVWCGAHSSALCFFTAQYRLRRHPQAPQLGHRAAEGGDGHRQEEHAGPGGVPGAHPPAQREGAVAAGLLHPCGVLWVSATHPHLVYPLTHTHGYTGNAHTHTHTHTNKQIHR